MIVQRAERRTATQPTRQRRQLPVSCGPSVNHLERELASGSSHGGRLPPEFRDGEPLFFWNPDSRDGRRDYIQDSGTLNRGDGYFVICRRQAFEIVAEHLLRACEVVR